MEMITFLRPDNPYPTHCCKAFGPGNPPVKIRDYSLGANFTFEQTIIEDLDDLRQEFLDRAQGWIRIAGQPRSGLQGSVRRNKENFPEKDSRLIMLDMDKWTIPETWPWDFTSPTSVHATVKMLLKTEGFQFLAETQFLCLLTASQFTTKTLSCHLYFFCSAPVSILILREWCHALQRYRGRTLFDPATQRSVQPDYIGRRECQGFVDPLPEEARISICRTGEPLLDYDLLQEQINRDCQLAGWTVGDEPKRPIGATWEETVKMAGQDDQGINEVAYRAAAQLVSQFGQFSVQENLDHYSKLLFDATWKALKINDPWLHQGRNRTADIETYNLARFKQYISSALSKQFGESTDESQRLVLKAIEDTKNGVSTALFVAPVMEAYTTLKRKHPAIYAVIRTEMKTKLRGIVSVTDYDKAVRGAIGRTEKGDSGFGNLDDISGDNQFVQQVIACFDWLEDEYGQKYAGWNGEASRYRLLPMSNLLSAVLYSKGMELSSGTVSPKFGSTVLLYHTGKEGLAHGGKNSLFRRAQVGLRVYPVGGPYARETTSWIYLGVQPSGMSLCVKVSAEGVEIVEEYDCPVRWRVPEDSASLPIATDEQVDERFGGTEGLKDWVKYMLPRYFNLEDEDRSTVLGILFSLLTGRGASPLIEFCGPPGSGKSTAADLLLELVDPTPGGLHSGDGRGDLTAVKGDQLINVVEKRYLTYFDNVSKLAVDVQDTLCKIATGASKDERVLYVGTYYKIAAKRPIVMTSLSPVVTRPDLASRTETINFNSHRGFAIPPESLLEEWLRDKPYLILGLLHLLADMLAMQDTVVIEDGVDARRKWMNLADYIFYSQEEIDEVRRRRKIEKSKEILESDDFAMAFLGWLQYKEEEEDLDRIEMRALDMFQEYVEWIEEKAGERIVLKLKGGGTVRWKVKNLYDKIIPRSVSGFGWQINKLANVLNDVAGWVVSTGEKRSMKGNIRVIYKKIELEDL